MKRITSKLTRVLVVTLLCAVTVTTANSQEQAKVIDLNTLAARGEALANEDPLAAELRNQVSENPARLRGFDIGMAVAEGHTLPGPGKDRICASLPVAGLGGCRIAVAFSVGRNRNAKLAAIGAKIAQADPAVAEARNAKPSLGYVAFYKLGFDIATGIFGDPTLGAQGNTAVGPGSRQVRNSLNVEGQLGFDASVKFHLSRLVRPDPLRTKNDNPYVFEKPIDANALAAKGEAIANADPLSAELRNRQPNDSARRGFDIGMAAAEGHTAPGPGKDRIGASLPPAEQRGFSIAVSFSLERNRNADLAARGAAIANVDEIVAEARTAETDVFYWLGFDIATGIFGDPALGAKGDTATSPVSQKIRDSLSAAAQRGFDASVKLHLSRRYRRK